MTHTFPFDPGSILGVPSGASLREIRDAYHQKSLKHHPDKGGDEWAFRLVAQAYEILSTARVVARASEEDNQRRPAPPPSAHFHSEPHAAHKPEPDLAADLKSWGGAPRSHEGDLPENAAKIINAELLILRFELGSSLGFYASSPGDRNLSCSLHVAWPVVEFAETASTLPGAARTLKKIGEAFKAKSVRKHALKSQSSVEHGRFEGWLTYPTAVQASEALDAFRDALQETGLVVEKQVREMAIPRPGG
jgi:hypothetical protein